MKNEPKTISDFRKIGKRKLAPRTAEEAKALHDKRVSARPKPEINVTIPKCRPEIRELKKRIIRNSVVVPLGTAGNPFVTMAYRDNPRKKNWRSTCAVQSKPVGGWRIETTDEGQYSSRCRFHKHTYQVQVHSVAYVMRSCIFFAFADYQLKKISAPKGYYWDRDNNGLKLVCKRSPSRDYHPAASELLEVTPHKIAARLQALAKIRRDELARKKREEKERRERKEKELEAVRRAEQEGATICLADSHRAGNCKAGTLSWASRHNLDERKHYTPSQVLENANGDASRVALVVTIALRRHRMEMERGYAELVDHRA